VHNLTNKKLSCRRETAGRFMSLHILLNHSRSFEMTMLRRACVKSLLVFHWNYVSRTVSAIFSIKMARNWSRG